jgi:alpha,alpha-trehalase
MTDWALVYDKFDPEQEGLREALCTLGNGFFATRGAVPEAEADGIHYPGTYIAGGYNRLKTEIAGREIENEDLVNFPNWLPLTFRIDDGKWFNLQAFEILSYRQKLDIREGTLLRTVVFRDEGGRKTHLVQRRLVHMAKPHLAALETTLVAENWSGSLEVKTALDGRVLNAGVERYKGLKNKHLRTLERGTIGEEQLFLKVETNQSEFRVAEAVRTRVFLDSQIVRPKRQVIEEPEFIGQQFSLEMKEGASVRIEKVLALYTSRDKAISECGLEARKSVAEAGSFEELVVDHRLAWKQLWDRFEIQFDGTSQAGRDPGMIIHLHLFHLLQTISMNTVNMDLDVGVPPRGWHGEAYRGHILWDELFVFPLLNLRIPEISRALLMYRYRRLGEARKAARKAGYQGAMFPWQSGSDGREETQEIHLNPKSGRWIPDRSQRQRHVNAAIVYNIHHYFQVTCDMHFLAFYGAEMVIEIARFWASRASYNADLDRFEILGVMGPDEFHDGYPNGSGGLNNNAYTNILATWVLDCALNVCKILPEDRARELFEILDLRPEEMNRWKEIASKVRIPFHDNGIISQFEGYHRLEEFDWGRYRKKYGNIQRLDRILEAEGDTPNRYKASKQADVLMLFYLFSSEELGRLFQQLGYPFEYETIPKNINYYIQRTSHGSTLSRVVHSWVLARSDRERSWKLFSEALQSDVMDIQRGTTPEGIHLGAMAGTVDLIQRGYTGVETRNHVLWFNPSLPAELSRLHLHLRYCGHWLGIEVTQKLLKIKAFASKASPIQIGHAGRVYELRENETREFDL